MVIDTSVWIRHLTGDPPALAEVATDFLADAYRPVLTDVVLAECVYVLESVYGVDRWRVAELMRSALDLVSRRFYVHDDVQMRSLEIYELTGLSYADAYLLAYAEYNNAGPVVTFDRGLKSGAESVGVRVLGED